MNQSDPVEYGIICTPSEEKQLIKNINQFLAGENFRKLYQKKDTSYKPVFLYDYYYCQFLKSENGWYFEIKLNQDLENKFRFPDHPEAGWTIYTGLIRPENWKDEDIAKSQSFFQRLIAAAGFPVITLYQYKPDEERI